MIGSGRARGARLAEAAVRALGVDDGDAGSAALTVLLNLEHVRRPHMSHRKDNVAAVTTHAGWSRQGCKIEPRAVAVLWEQCLNSPKVLLIHWWNCTLSVCPHNPRQVVVVSLGVEEVLTLATLTLTLIVLPDRNRTQHI